MEDLRGALEAVRGKARARARRAVCMAGETLAATHLEGLGYLLLARNLRVAHDEADLVMLSPCRSTVVIVEVKARSEPGARPEERIDYGKRASLTRLARVLGEQPALRTHRIRFDVIAVVLPPGAPPELVHFIDAWEASAPT